MRRLVIVFFILLLTACGEEKKQYEQAVLAQMQDDQDIKDYNIDPETMTECVVDLTSKKMPGIVSIDPRREPYYIAYSKLISVKTSKDPRKTLQEIHEAFGSTAEVRKALNNYSSGVMECITALVSKSEKEQSEL